MQPVYKNVGECIETQRKDFKIQTNQYLPMGEIPVIDQGAAFITGYIDDPAKAYTGPLPVIVFGDHTCCLKYVSVRFAVGADGTQLIRPNSDFDVRYFYYALQAQKMEHFGYQRHFKLLKTKDVPWFPLSTQRKITAILSAYDDLIENNLRRIKILEEMAQNLYREWFVKFRFPGHQHARFTDSPLGPIPEGWKFQRLDELCSAVLDGDWIETKDQGGEDYRLLQISNIGLGDFVETGKFRYVTQETFDCLRCTEIQPDDLLIARMPTPIGRGWLARKMPWRIITAVDVAIARPDIRRIRPVFLLHFWNQPSTLAAIEKQSSGTTRLRITRRELCAMPIPTPSLDLQDQFSAKAQPMLDMGNILRDKNTTLRRTRGLLLPKLISGEVDVSELDIAVPEEDNKA